MDRVRLDTSLELLLERLAATDAASVIATIVATAGSTYRKSGARMLIEADGRMTGLLSGGCLEHDLRERALAVLARGAGEVIGYDTRGADDLIFGIGSGCEGAMRILLEPAHPDSRPVRSLRDAAARSRAGHEVALAVIHAGPAAALGTHLWPAADALSPPLAAECAARVRAGDMGSIRWSESSIAHEAWVQYLAPPPRVLVCGAGADAELLVAGLAALRFRITVVDHRPAYARPERFAGATVHAAPAETLAARLELEPPLAAIVMSHHLASDAAYLSALAAAGHVPYVGLLGPRPRRERLLGDLGAERVAALKPRLRGPVGLDIGAVTPEGIALAIAGELHAFAAGRDGGPCSRPEAAP